MQRIKDLLIIAHAESAELSAKFRQEIVSHLQSTFDFKVMAGEPESLEFYSGLADMLFKLNAHDWTDGNIEFFCQSVIGTHLNIKKYGDLYEN